MQEWFQFHFAIKDAGAGGQSSTVWVVAEM
jgi:hypothetical protein